MKSYIKISSYAKIMGISKKSAYIHFYKNNSKRYKDLVLIL